MSATKRSKQAFDAERTAMFSFDPMALRIIGGLVLSDDEQGPLDTEEDIDNALYDKRLHIPLDDQFKANVYTFGVDTPILVAKIDGVPTVVAGKRRVRAARLANTKRLAAGEPPITVDAKIKRGSDLENMGALFRENRGRLDDNLVDNIEGLKRYMNRGVSLENAAVNFNITAATAKTWLAFDDNAIAETKKAEAQGLISPSAAMTLARIHEPMAQKIALASLLETASTGKKASTREAKIAANNTGNNNVVGVTDKKTLRKFVEAIKKVVHPHNSSEKTMAWWQGVEDALNLVVGDAADERLRKVLIEVRGAAKAKTKAKK